MSASPSNTFSTNALSPFLQQQNRPELLNKQEHSRSSKTSLDTVQHTSIRKPSASSAVSLESLASDPLWARNENVSPSRTASHVGLRLAGSPANSSSAKLTRKQASHKSSLGNETTQPPQPKVASSFLTDTRTLENLDLAADNCQHNVTGDQVVEQDNQHTTGRGLSFDVNEDEQLSTERSSIATNHGLREGHTLNVITDTASHSIRRWMSTLRLKNPGRKKALSVRKDRWSLDDFDEEKPAELDLPKARQLAGHRKTSSWSSNGFVTAVKSATTGLGPSSAANISQKGRRSRLLGRSSKLSDAANRHSMDGSRGSTQMLDEAALGRAIQRRKILEELVSSEEGYINDLKILAHVYFTILASTPNFPRSMQTRVERNLSDILLLHEEILIQIKAFMKDSGDSGENRDSIQKKSKHNRGHSLESIRAKFGREDTRAGGRSIDGFWFGRSRNRCQISEPQVAADIARIFDRMVREVRNPFCRRRLLTTAVAGMQMSRFFVYEEYGAKYESMLQIVASTSKTIPNWYAYERGIEALVNSLFPLNATEERNRKCLTFEDLLIKPIQRICRYPLLFAELHKYSPAMDGPETQAEIAKVLSRLRETAREINKATNDQQTQARVQRSWHLQDLLVFPDTSVAPFPLRFLGHAKLCGALYVSYQSNGELRGQYMLCALFSSYFLLASRNERDKQLRIVAIIGLGDIQVDVPDNGRGLQCHNALFSWKLMFESDQQLYELIFCACSEREEEQWKAEILHYSAMECHRQTESLSILTPEYSLLALDIKTLGAVFGQPGTLTRRLSMQRAATINPRTSVTQIIINNTHCPKDHHDSVRSASASLSRSHSLLSTNRIPILAPERADRIRLEHVISNAWTKELLPYPGMIANRGGQFIRASASSMMRKLSKASVTSNARKRAVSYTSFSETNSDSTRSEAICSDQTDVGVPLIEWDERVTVRSKYENYGETCFDVERSASRNEVRKVSRLLKRARKSQEGSDTSTIVAGRGSLDLGHVKGKLRKPKTLLKAFSTEGIRGWFT